MIEESPCSRVSFSDDFEDVDNALSTADRKEWIIFGLTSIIQKSCDQNTRKMGISAQAPSHGYRSINYPDGSASFFFSQWMPQGSILDLMTYVVHSLPFSFSVFTTALVYIQRVSNSDDGMGVTHLSVHRIFLVAVLLAQKYQEDEPWNNLDFLGLGLIPSVEELNMLEVKFLTRIDYRLFVDVDEYRWMEEAVMSR